MNNKLPNVYVNNQIKKINNKRLFYLRDNLEEKKKESTDNMINELFIQKKINDIFNSFKFIYKIKVLILTKDGESKETIIARNYDNLITINDKKILIKDIKDIKII